MSKHSSHCKRIRLGLWRDERGEAMVSFGLVLPVLLVMTFGILEFSLAAVERHQASQALRILTRGVAIHLTTDDLSNISAESSTKCTLQDSGWACAGGTISNWSNLYGVWTDAQTVLPRLNLSNVELTITPTSLADADAEKGTMALVTLQFVNLDYQSKVFTFYDDLMTKILFGDISASLILGG